MTTQNTTKLTVILDAVGRTILGEAVESTDPSITPIKNPTILIVQQQQDGRMSIGLHPIIFREFLGDKTSDVVFNYQTASITKSDIDTLDFRLQAQYGQIFNGNNAFVAPSEQPAESSNVINLFDE